MESDDVDNILENTGKLSRAPKPIEIINVDHDSQSSKTEEEDLKVELSFPSLKTIEIEKKKG